MRIGLLVWVVVLFIGIALTGCGYSSLPLVRECGAVVGDHFSAQSFDWVQPCERESRSGCEEHCRRAKDACEAAQAAYRQEPRGQSKAQVEYLSARIDADCPPPPPQCVNAGGWYIKCPLDKTPCRDDATGRYMRCP